MFGVLSIFFGVAIVGSLLLPELRGRQLTETLGEEEREVAAAGTEQPSGR